MLSPAATCLFACSFLTDIADIHPNIVVCMALYTTYMRQYIAECVAAYVAYLVGHVTVYTAYILYLAVSMALYTTYMRQNIAECVAAYLTFLYGIMVRVAAYVAYVHTIPSGEHGSDAW